MRSDDLQNSIRSNEYKDQNPSSASDGLLGHIIACSGSKATIVSIATSSNPPSNKPWTVGKLIIIDLGATRVAAIVYQMRAKTEGWSDKADNAVLIDVELIGEISQTTNGLEKFNSGITRYPHIGAIARRASTADLISIYDSNNNTTRRIGCLSQDDTIDAKINISQMLNKHFAVVGSTGVGKSTAVSLLLNKAITADPKLRVLILDPHNEFAAAFPDNSVVIDTDTLDLPFWLMKMEEFMEVICRGSKPVPEEVDILRDLIPEAKRAFRGADHFKMRRHAEKSSMTVDTPVPYRIADLLALLDERIGRLEGREEKPILRALKIRIQSVINDPRYNFMFSNSTITDNILETVAHIFRIPGDGKPISVFQLSGIPAEVVNSLASVLCRMAFELALLSRGAIHTLVVCEEAHRYIPSNPELGFFPTRQAIARIAKEGRKYGVSLGIITQRPGELDQTILSQCSTVFAMRLTNESDQNIIQKAIPNASISTTSFLASIGNGEAIAFGEAITVPMRMKFDRVSEINLPRTSGVSASVAEDTPESVDLSSIVLRMRSVNKPNISSLQQSYEAAAGYNEEPSQYSSKQWESAQQHTNPNAPMTPYNPSMLPREKTMSYGSNPASEPPALSIQPTPHTGKSTYRDINSPVKDSGEYKPLTSLYRKDQS